MLIYYMVLASLPAGMNLFEVYVDTKMRRARPWAESTPPFTYDPDRPFFETLVPTTDTARYGHLLRRWLAANRPTIFTGDTGTYYSQVNLYTA